MGGMVLHTELPFDDFGNTRTCPYVTSKIVCFRTIRQEFRYLVALGHIQFQRTARVRTRIQRFQPIAVHRMHPLAHRAFRDPEPVCNLLLGPTVLFELESAKAPCLFPVMGR